MSILYKRKIIFINMAKSRHRKNHKQKVAARKQKVEQNKNRMRKWQQNMLEQFIAQEQAQGAFNGTASNTPLVDPNAGDIIMEGPSL